MSSCGSNVGMETSAPLVDTIVNNAVVHSNSRINQTPPQIGERFARWPMTAVVVVVFSPGLVFASFLVFGWLLKPDCSSSDSGRFHQI